MAALWVAAVLAPVAIAPAAEAASAPVVASPGGQTSATGVAVSLAMKATGGKAPLVWSASALPAGLTINSSTGVVSGKPTATGRYTTTVTAKDAAKLTGKVSFSWDVAAPLTLTNPGTLQVTAGQPLTKALTASGGTTPYAWSASGLPSGLTINASTGVITGTPATPAAAAAVSVTVTDAAKRSAAASFSLLVDAAVQVVNPGNQRAVVGRSTSLTMKATGGKSPYTWSATGLPTGLALTKSTGLVSGTPTAAASYGTKVIATDSAGKAGTVTFAWNVATAVGIDYQDLSGVVGTAVNLTLHAVGGSSPFTWSVTGLPSGLTLDPPTGSITGVPADISTDSESFPLGVTVTDADGSTSSTELAFSLQRRISMTMNWTFATDDTFRAHVPALPAGYSVQIVDLTTGAVVPATPEIVTYSDGTTGSTGTYAARLPFKASGTHRFSARIVRTGTTEVLDSSLPVSYNFSGVPTTRQNQDLQTDYGYTVVYPDAGAVSAVTVHAMTNTYLTTSASYLEVEDNTTGEILASCATSFQCDATITPARASHDIIVVQSTYPGGVRRRDDVQDRRHVGKIDFGAWWVDVSPVVSGNADGGQWSFDIATNRFPANDSPYRPNWTKMTAFDTTTGYAVTTGCSSDSSLIRRTFPRGTDYMDFDYQWQAGSRPPVWRCIAPYTSLRFQTLDPTHSVQATIQYDQDLACSVRGSLNDCGTQLVASGAASMAGGIPWRYVRNATWRGGANPEVPPSQVELADVPAAGTSPWVVHNWWQNQMNDVQIAYAVRTYPRQIGDLDGLPTAVRDQANRANLAAAKSQLSAQRARILDRAALIQSMIDQGRIRELYPDAADAAEARLQADAELTNLEAGKATVDAQLGGVGVVEDRLAVTSPRAYLVRFSTTEGKGRAVVAINDPDLSDNVISYVPGTYAGLGTGLATDIRRADIMARDSGAEDPSKTTAALAWLGYDAPQSVLPAAATDGYADTAAPDLRRFQQGLRAAHQNGAGHLVLLGHSYGTTVVGHTARESVEADDIVLVASPGVGVDNTNDLRATTGGGAPAKFWATTAKCDIIGQAADVWRLESSAADFVYRGADVWKSLINGTNPVHPAFGAQVFRSDDGICSTLMGPTDTHSAYWDEGNQARKGFAQIAVGEVPELVTY
ncbi:putative Ig domain-containing protein [Actinoplanes sp. RD1]|uniref:putative Ig domain-containing protein n=1 Tax=Actinoplanes sp. RD1 TaxID=3064538 RepID=UPI002741E368|nr:putative Ig domain-containing protein [Actinoplanes sp. RD1]